MASLTYDSINATTRTRFIPALRDQIFQQNYLFWKLLKGADMGAARDGGTKVLEPLEYAKNTYIGAYAAGAQLTYGAVATFTAAEFNWCRYRGTSYIEGLEELEYRGAARVIDFMAAKMKNTAQAMADDMATDMFSDGTGDANGFVGLAAMIDDGTNIGAYGGITPRSTYVWWKSYYADKGAGAFALTNWRALITGTRVNNEQPTLLVTTQAELDAYENILLGATPTFSLTTMTQMTELDGGFKAYLFRGIPMIWDSHMSANRIYALNTNYIHFRVIQDFTSKGWQRPVDYDVLVHHTLWKGALTGSGCRFQGQLRHT